jgi:hypothetical protein
MARMLDNLFIFGGIGILQHIVQHSGGNLLQIIGHAANNGGGLQWVEDVWYVFSLAAGATVCHYGKLDGMSIRFCMGTPPSGAVTPRLL